MEATNDQWVEAEAETELAMPWPRFWARLFDLNLFSFPIAFALGVVFPAFFSSPIFASRAGDVLVGIMVLPLVLIADACVIALFGTSPGKALAGLAVRDMQSNKPALDQALRRNLLLYLRGYMLGIPILTLVGFISAYNRVNTEDTASWDDDTDTRVISTGNNSVRTALAAVAAIGLLIAIRALSS